MSATRSDMGGEPQVELRRYLAARLRPLAILLLAVVSISAPVAFVVMGSRTVTERAQGAADQVAEEILEEVQQRPMLWRYDAGKLERPLRAHVAQASIIRIDITDPEGRRIDLGGPPPLSPEGLLWATAPVELDNHAVAHVWVGASSREVERQAILLLLGFVALGAVLAGVMYWLPLRAMSQAEDRIRALIARLRRSQQALASLNENLEEQVQERSHQLEEALAEVRNKERNLRELSSRAASLQEAERRALSRELHDSAGQALTAIRINLQLLAQQATEGSGTQKIARRTVDLADSTVDEIRRVVDRLAPAILDDVGLADALERHCDDFAERTGVEVDRTFRELDMEGVGSGIETALYRIAQEALTNVARHSGANRVDLSVGRRDDALWLTVEDDGAGFDVEAARQKGRRGLQGMRERVELLGGDIRIDSAEGRGTRIEVSLPIPPGDPPGSIEGDAPRA